MFGLNTQGLIFSGIFLLIGLFDTWVLNRLIYGRIWENYQRRQNSGETSLHPETIINLMLVINIIVFPVIGYVVGPSLASAFGFGSMV